MYEYRATAIEVHDGDTLKLDVDLGLRTHHIAWFRLSHINAPELKDAGGAATRDRVKQLVGSQILIIRTTKDKTEKYGRWLCEIILPDNRDLGTVLVEEGLARPYEGGRR